VTSEAVINGNTNLMTVHLPNIVSGPIYIQSDPALVCASAPMYTGSIDFGGGKQVPSCP
jgi:hypothetical protein